MTEQHEIEPMSDALHGSLRNTWLTALFVFLSSCEMFAVTTISFFRLTFCSVVGIKGECRVLGVDASHSIEWSFVIAAVLMVAALALILMASLPPLRRQFKNVVPVSAGVLCMVLLTALICVLLNAQGIL